MADTAVTYTPAPPIEGRTFVCKRCKRSYAYPAKDARPIRCECGWWYYNDGRTIHEAYNQRIEPYRTPPADDFHKIFR
jgi:hypothetical protein